MRRLAVTVTVATLILGLSTSASARISKRDLARKHFAKGFAYYQNKDYLKAVVELKKAYRIRPVPVVLFYIGKTFQAAGLHNESARHFWQFLDESTLNDRKRPEAIAALKAMNMPLKAPSTSVTPVGPDPGTPRVTPRVTPRPVRRRKPSVKPGEIIHEVVEDARPGHPMTMEAELPEDFGTYARIYLYYRPKGQEAFIKKVMRSDRRGIYHGCIPRRHMRGTSIQYYIEAMGRTGKRKAGSGTARSPNIVALDKDSPLQAGGRLQGCPDDTGPARTGPVGPSGGGTGPAKFGGTKLPSKGSLAAKKRLKIIGLVALGAAAIASFGAGVGMSLAARSKAREMANAAVNGPRFGFDGEIAKIEKQGKALDIGAIFLYVVGSLALGGAAWLAVDTFVKKPKTERPTKTVENLRITPTIGPQAVGLSGGFDF